jgi:hypothetical protein
MYLLILNSTLISTRQLFDSPENAAASLFDSRDSEDEIVDGYELYKIDLISQIIMRVPIPKIRFEY